MMPFSLFSSDINTGSVFGNGSTSLFQCETDFPYFKPPLNDIHLDFHPYKPYITEQKKMHTQYNSMNKDAASILENSSETQKKDLQNSSKRSQLPVVANDVQSNLYKRSASDSERPNIPIKQRKIDNKKTIKASTPEKVVKMVFNKPNGYIPSVIYNSDIVMKYYQSAQNSVLSDGLVINKDTINKLLINPLMLGFIPKSQWSSQPIYFNALVKVFFHQKNKPYSRFSMKLYNALKITTFIPQFYPFVGVQWVNDTVIKVDKAIFARLLGINSINGSLFHRQGNFPTHGFVELTDTEATSLRGNPLIEDVDYDNVRLIRHKAGVFTRNCTEEDLEECQWISSRTKHTSSNDNNLYV